VAPAGCPDSTRSGAVGKAIQVGIQRPDCAEDSESGHPAFLRDLPTTRVDQDSITEMEYAKTVAEEAGCLWIEIDGVPMILSMPSYEDGFPTRVYDYEFPTRIDD